MTEAMPVVAAQCPIRGLIAGTPAEGRIRHPSRRWHSSLALQGPAYSTLEVGEEWKLLLACPSADEFRRQPSGYVRHEEISATYGQGVAVESLPHQAALDSGESLLHVTLESSEQHSLIGGTVVVGVS